MESCSWCGNFTDKLVKNGDSMICQSCQDKYDNNICRRCGTVFSNSFMVKGLCLNCMQVEEVKKSQKRDEAMLGIDGGNTIGVSREFQMTEKDYEDWVTFESDKYSPAQLKKDRTLKRIWIMVKLNAIGIYDEKIINENMDDIEELLDQNFFKLLKNKCQVILINTMKDRQRIGSGECIAHKNKVFIMKKD